MHKALFASKVDTPALLDAKAKEVELDAAAFSSCIATPLAAQSASAVTLVPTFFLNGEKFVGLLPYPDLRGKIETKLTMNN
jgi:protein-disulfide isomerase